MVFSYEEFSVPAGALVEDDYAYVNGVEGTKTLDGKTYDVICSDGFAPALMNKPVYAIPVVVNSNNEVVASGEMHKFSIFEYCTTRFAQTPTADQYELYTSMLEFSASAQELLQDTNEDVAEVVEAYGYADAYYVVNATFKVDGALTAVEKLCYRDPEVTLNPEKTYNGKMFAGFENANGETVGAYGADTASSWNYYDTTLAIGDNNFTFNYKTAGKIQTWDSVAAITGSNLIYQQSGSNIVFDTLDTTKTSVYVEDGTLKMFNKLWVPITIANKNSTAGAVGKTYVFESDVKFDFDTTVSRSQSRIAYLDLSGSASNGYNTNFMRFSINWDGKSDKSDVAAIRYLDENLRENYLCNINLNEEFNLRIEYEVVTLKSDSAVAVGKVKLYINGELAATIDEAKSWKSERSNSTFGGVHLEFNHTNIGELYATFDNTYIATE